MTSNVKQFRVNEDKRLDLIMKEVKELFEREFGKGNFAAYVSLVASKDLGNVPDDQAEVTSYRFTVAPQDRSDEDSASFAELLYQSLSRDTNIGTAVVHRYSNKLAEVLANLIEADNAEEEVN